MLAACLFHHAPGSPQAGSSPARPRGQAPYFFSGFLLVLVRAKSLEGTRKGCKTAGWRCRSRWSPATRPPPNGSPCSWWWWRLKWRRRGGGVSVKERGVVSPYQFVLLTTTTWDMLTDIWNRQRHSIHHKNTKPTKLHYQLTLITTAQKIIYFIGFFQFRLLVKLLNLFVLNN